MEIYDIKDVIKGLEKRDKEKVIFALSPLISQFIKENKTVEDILQTLNDCGIDLETEVIKNIVTKYEINSVSQNSFSDEITNAIQGIENILIFNDSSPKEYLKRAQSSIYPYNSSAKTSMTIRQIALNMCNYYQNRIEMFHDSRKICFGYKSSISIDMHNSKEYVSIWLDFNDASSLLGFNWKNSLNDFLKNIADKISNYNEIQVAILQQPFNAIHVKILPN